MSLIKQHIYNMSIYSDYWNHNQPRKMKFQVTDIAFDFSDDAYDEPITDEYKEDLREGVFGTIWEADDEEDLVEEITCSTGWCIKSIDYRHILN